MLPTPLSAPSRVALASAATGIRDAAGNLSSFAATAPTDGARPVLVSGTLVMRDVDGKRQGRPRARHLLARRSSPPPTPHPGRSRTSPAQARSPRSRPRARLRRSSSAEGAGAQNTAVGTFRVVLAASATGIRDAAGNQASFGSTAPVDQATPVLVSLVMQDVNTNGKVDRVLATFSESLAAYSAGTAPWTLANVPSGGSLSSVSVAGAVATLTIAEGAGAPDTAVGSFTRRACERCDRHPRRGGQPLVLRSHGTDGRGAAGARRRHARDARRRRKRQGRPRARHLLARRRALLRHRTLDAHERPQRRLARLGLDLGRDCDARHLRRAPVPRTPP